jgi:superfamily II DNA or RNA helicase
MAGGGWLFDPSEPVRKMRTGPAGDGSSRVREPHPEVRGPGGAAAGDEDALGPEERAFAAELLACRMFLHDLGRLLASGRFEAAERELEDMALHFGDDAIVSAARAWVMAGLGRLEESAEAQLRAELHAARSAWHVENWLRNARACQMDVRKERARRARRPKAAGKRAAKRPRVSAPARAGPEGPTLPAAEVPLRFHLDVRTQPPGEGVHADVAGEDVDAETAFADYRRRAQAVRVDRFRQYDTLLALGAARGVDHYGYQLRTVRRVLRDFRGRALLADEVGLGKTIEACLCLEEYLQRGLARRALLLVPPGLLEQWRDELQGKFGREPVIVTGERARRDPGVWAREPLVLASLALARAEPHASAIAGAGFDMVIVDEAHRLKNRRTLLWRLVDRIRARYLLMLSATPVENDLLEIYNVLCLLRPGLFSTRAEFKRRFVARGRRTPKDPGALRQLLRRVMIRNTRATAEAQLPPRFATTLRARPGPAEAAFRERLDVAIREAMADGVLSRRQAGGILRATGARPPAAARLVERHLGGALGDAARALGASAKDDLLADVLTRRPGDQVIVFAMHRETVAHVAERVAALGRRVVVFDGSLSAAEKARAVASFRDGGDVLVATEAGGEGFNLHFARTVVNYDLPWNPMRIEQRIGRVHRIGQQREVFVFNLVAEGSIEDEILRVLDEKIDMFELVVGEVEAILGRLGDDEREFSDLVLDIYTEAADADEMRARFDALAERMTRARAKHLRTVEIESEIFGRELEV